MGVKASVGVLGLGYVGLPLAHGFVQAGHRVIGYDLSGGLIRDLMNGKSHVDDLPDDSVREMVREGFTATTQVEELADASAYIICVPTPLGSNGGPDLSAVKQAGEAVSRVISPGDLVVLESTTYPGTTEKVLRPILEQSGLSAGIDFALAFSPERIDPGNNEFGFVNTPKIVGGLTENCRDRAIGLYESAVERVIPAKGLAEAEMAKLIENTYRVVNIALVNEMAKFSHDLGIDLWNAIDCAATKPFGFQPFHPGPGVGGHCIPIDPNYLSFHVRTEMGYSFRFVELAQEINNSMAGYVVRRIADLLNGKGSPLRGAKVLLIGITYKPDIADLRETPALAIARELRKAGVDVEFLDPFVDTWAVDNLGVPKREALNSEGIDCAVVLQHHSQIDSAEVLRGARCALDTRGKVRSPGVEVL